MKARKKCVLAGVLAALLLFTSCDTINAYLSGEQQTPQDPTEASRAEEVKKAMEEGGMKKIGDTVECENLGGVTMAYTVQKVEIFDDYRDAGIPEEEFSQYPPLNDNPLVVVEVKAKKVSGPEKQETSGESEEDKFTDYQHINAINIYNRDQMEEIKEKGSTPITEMIYFSGHPSAKEDPTGKYYCQFWLDPGEEEVFQIAWQVYDPVFEHGKKTVCFDNLDGGLYLKIDEVAYVDLEVNREESTME